MQKYGRTTGLTHGTVSEISVTVNVCYEGFVVCTKWARFVDQIAITDGTFSGGGDSGSLIVTHDANKYPVGLLFAGSSTRTIANPIGPVLQRFNVTIDDGSGGGSPGNSPPSGFTLTATGYKVKGLQKVDLAWSDATSDVDVYRNGDIVTTENDGFHTDNIDKRGGGTYTYKVCDGTVICSNNATVTF